MVRLAILAVAAALFIAASVRAEPTALDAEVSALGQAYLAAESGMGLTIGIVDNGRTHVFNFGVASRGGPTPTGDTAYEIGSIAKTMTGLLLARGVLAGRAGLQDDVRRYLDGAYPRLEHEGEPVRLLHLANMTSALPDNLPDLSHLLPDPGRHATARAAAAYTQAQFLEDLRALAPRERPGASVAHSNLAARMLNIALERIDGAPYRTILAREIEAPLRMTATSEATGYDSEGLETAATPADSFGNRYSMTAMLRYAALQLDESDAAVRLSHEGSWFTLDRRTAVAMPWIVATLPGGGRQLRYSGGTYGFASYMALWPERRLAIVLLANKSSDTAQGRMGEIATRIADLLQPAR